MCDSICGQRQSHRLEYDLGKRWQDSSEMARNEQLIRQHKLLQILERTRFGYSLSELRDALRDELGLTSLHTRTLRRDIDALQAAGLDVENARQDLKNPKSIAEIKTEAEGFRQAGVSGVPTFIVNERTGFAGALPPARLAETLREAANVTRVQ